MKLIGKLVGWGESKQDNARIYQSENGEILLIWKWGSERIFATKEEFQVWLKETNFISEVIFY